ncbi:hypothetical protein [Nocardioides sp.]|uniref:hypothetical protein n=1 Tax=Nocardioides sp. TaxID=35761 RepID=UPI0039E38C37
MSNCSEATDGADTGPGLNDILRAFRSVPLPASVLQIQPPNGETLVNFETNFLTHADPFDTTLTLLGHRVDFRIKASSFHWHYGDGKEERTAKPGDVYPHLQVTHEYRRKGQVAPSVDTTWSADYRIDNGPWATVPDTVTITGATQALTIRTATPVLVGS